MKPPIVITTSNPDVTEVVTRTVWHCNKPGHPGMLVYTQANAVSKIAEGFDVEIGTVVRLPQWLHGRHVCIETPCSVCGYES